MERVEDYAYARGASIRTANELTIEDHLGVLTLASHYVDSAVSKTCNVGDEVTFDEFKDVYKEAWKNGNKGITTFRASGKRFGILQAPVEEKASDTEKAEGAAETSGAEENQATACFIDPSTGVRECS